MKPDFYTKAVLTIVAVMLTVIACNQYINPKATALAQSTAKSLGSAGRYQLLSARYNWLAVDAENKLVVNDKDQLFRIDTGTGEASILMFQPGANSQPRSFWLPVGK